MYRKFILFPCVILLVVPALLIFNAAAAAAAAASSRLQSWPPCYSRERPRWTARFTMGNYQQAVVPMPVPSLYISGAKALGGRLDSCATAIVAVRCSFGRNDIYSLSPLSLPSSLVLTNSHFVVRGYYKASLPALIISDIRLYLRRMKYMYIYIYTQV